MVWAEQHRVDYVLGLARNPRLVGEIAAELAPAKAEAEQTGKAARCFKDFRYQTLDSWSCERRVVGKAEQLPAAAARPAPTRASWSPRSAPRPGRRSRSTSGSTAPAARWKTGSRNASSTCSPTGPPRARCGPTSSGCGSPRWPTCCSTALRRIALPATRLAQATAGTIRLRLLKIGALVRVSVRRVTIEMASGHPWQRDWAIAHRGPHRGGRLTTNQTAHSRHHPMRRCPRAAPDPAAQTPAAIARAGIQPAASAADNAVPAAETIAAVRNPG